MGLRERISNFLAAPVPADANPKTYAAVTGGQQIDYFTKRDQNLEKYRRIYQQGGIVSEAIDCYALFMLSSGWRLEGGSESQRKTIEDFFNKTDIESVLWRGIVDSLVVKKGLAEIAMMKGNASEIAALIPRPAEMFIEKYDDYGNLLGYEQTVMVSKAKKTTIPLKPEQMFRIDLDLPLIERALDEITRDVEIADGTAKAIQRHGFPRWHLSIGEGEYISKEAMTPIETAFQNLKPSHEMATGANVKIENIDSQGVPQTKLYGEWAVNRLSTALGVPEELLGLGRGSTEATANVKLQAFYNKIGTLQKRAARATNMQVIDRILKKEGIVKMVFNDVSPVDELMRAQVISTLLGATPVNPELVVNAKWCRDFLGVTIEEEEEEKPVVRVPQLPPPFNQKQKQPTGEE